MEIDPTSSGSAGDTLLGIVSGPLSSAEAALSAHSRPIPSGRDFHFYNSFPSFRFLSDSLLSTSNRLLSRFPCNSPPPTDPEDALSWLVDLNDYLFEQLDASIDQFKSDRSSGRDMGVASMETGGFQIVQSKKSKRKDGSESEGGKKLLSSGARVLARDRKTGEFSVKVPFHIPDIPRPQTEFGILVDNSNQPFEHVWLERTADGAWVHPMEKLSVGDFVSRSTEEGEPVKPRTLVDTPFKLVEEVKDLKELSIKLRHASEFAIDLEHNQYRSFLGLTCLMQISTRTEDFIVDTLKLRIHVGPHLREVFKDPSKRKVMHGADRDILWLQRDFGIYVCNLFDTGQASRVLKLERNSLEYLLHHYCDVNLNKEYQTADWRLRPIPDEMLKYAREDTHFLLYLYDLMRLDLLAASTDTENGDALMEVYKRSSDVCTQLYEKELLTNTSFLYIYGLRGADFNAEQLAVVAALCEWRDYIARTEDESTGYVLPNRVLLEIARHMPATANKLRQLVKSKHLFLERNISSVVTIIKSAVNNAPAFEYVIELLRKEKMEKHEQVTGSQFDACKDPEYLQTGMEVSSFENTLSLMDEETSTSLTSDPVGFLSSKTSKENLSSRNEPEFFSSNGLCGAPRDIGEANSSNLSTLPKLTKGDNAAFVQALKKPTGAFGALLGSNSSGKHRPTSETSKSSEKEVAERKLLQIKPSLSLPFFPFPAAVTIENGSETSKPPKCLPSEDQENGEMHTGRVLPEEIMLLEDESEGSVALEDKPETGNNPNDCKEHSRDAANIRHVPDTEVEDESPSLAELSSCFQKCFNSLQQQRSRSSGKEKPKGAETLLQLKPFDYATARKEVNIHVQVGEVGQHLADQKSSRGARGKGTRGGRDPSSSFGNGESGSGFLPARRRHAFPSSGNRNATFK